MPGVDFLYSIKTNPFMPVLKTVAAQSFGADAASANEVLMAHEAGMAKNITLPHAEIGDILAVSNAGSYDCTLTPLFFSNQETPKEFLWTYVCAGSRWCSWT